MIWEGEEYCLIEMAKQDQDKKKVVEKKPRTASPKCECATTTFPSTTVTRPGAGAELPPTTTAATTTTTSSDLEDLEDAVECEE